MISELRARYPRQVRANDEHHQIRMIDASQGDTLLAFSATVAPDDLLFLRRDIRHPRVMEAWMQGVADEEIVSLALCRDDTIIGCSAVVTDPHSFSPHVGDVRVLLAANEQSHGLGRDLIQESFLVALAMNLKKLTVRMTTNQRAAMTVFEDLGFKAEALLKDHVCDAEGTLHDLVIMSHDVDAVRARMELYGMDELAAD